MTIQSNSVPSPDVISELQENIEPAIRSGSCIYQNSDQPGVHNRQNQDDKLINKKVCINSRPEIFPSVCQESNQFDDILRSINSTDTISGERPYCGFYSPFTNTIQGDQVGEPESRQHQCEENAEAGSVKKTRYEPISPEAPQTFMKGLRMRSWC